ncbi:hypothetical protein MTO96_001821 [Rhipicephalus appendiculatus]
MLGSLTRFREYELAFERYAYRYELRNNNWRGSQWRPISCLNDFSAETIDGRAGAWSEWRDSAGKVLEGSEQSYT